MMGPGDISSVKPRDRILEAARELFRKHGIRGVGVDAIASAADSNKMTLYRHFGSKDDLIVACLQEAVREANKFWEEIAQRHPGDALGQLEDWIEQVAKSLKAGADCNCEIIATAFQLMQDDGSAHAVINDFKASQRLRLEQICREAGIANYALLTTTLALLAEGARANRQNMGSRGLSSEFASVAHATVKLFRSTGSQ